MDKPYRTIAKAIRVIESCETFGQLKMAYNYWILLHEQLSGVNDFYSSSWNGYKLIDKLYRSKYKELNPKEESK